MKIFCIVLSLRQFSSLVLSTRPNRQRTFRAEWGKGKREGAPNGQVLDTEPEIEYKPEFGIDLLSS